MESLTRIPFEVSENYKLFLSKYHLQTIILSNGDKWRFYDTGNNNDNNNNDNIPLILIPGTTGTANIFYQQLLSLGLRGYRLISLTIPCLNSVELLYVHLINS